MKDGIESYCQEFVNNLGLVKRFIDQFPQTKYSEAIIKRLLSELSRKNATNRRRVKELIQIFPETPSSHTLKQLFINHSESLEEYVKAIKIYPSIIDNPAQKALERVMDLDDAEFLLETFGDQPEFEFKYIELLSPSNSQEEIYRLNDLFDYLPAPVIEEGILKSIGLNENIDDCYYQLDRFPDYKPQIISKAFDLINTIYDCLLFRSYFPKSSYDKEVLQQITYLLQEEFNECENSIDCYQNFISYHTTNKTYDPNRLVNEAREKVDVLKSMNTLAKYLGSVVISCCSYLGDSSRESRFFLDQSYEDKNLGQTIVPFRIDWVSAANGGDYFVEGELIISKDGKSINWLPGDNSTGIVPKCEECINIKLQGRR